MTNAAPDGHSDEDAPKGAGAEDGQSAGAGEEAGDRGHGEVVYSRLAIVRSCVMAVVAGVVVVVQTGINSTLSDTFFEGGVEGLHSTFTNFLVGFTGITILAIAHRPRFDDWSLSKAPWYSFLGGPCGVVYIASSILLGKKLGATLYFVLLVTGTLITSTVFDATGFLGLKKQGINQQKIVGVVLLFAGLLLLQDYDSVSNNDLEGWERGVYAVLVLLTGFFLPMQTLLNKTMAATAGTPYRAAVISFGTGLSTAFVVCVVANLAYERTSIGHSTDWWAFTGGLLGMYFVTAATMSVPVIGAMWYFCLQVSSQMTTAFFFDTFAWLSFKETSVTAMRVCGVVVAVLAVLVYSTHSLNLCRKCATGSTVNAPDNDDEQSKQPDVEVSVVDADTVRTE